MPPPPLQIKTSSGLSSDITAWYRAQPAGGIHSKGEAKHVALKVHRL